MAVPPRPAPPARRPRGVRNRILVESAEVNMLVYAYLVESGHVASATAFRAESHLDTSPFFGLLRPDLVDVRSEPNPTGENMAIINENGSTSETTFGSSTRRRTTSGKELQEVRAAAKVAMENNSSMSPTKENGMVRERSHDGQKARGDGNAGRGLLPRDELVAYLQRGLLWQEAVQHANDDVLDNCTAEFRLLKPHTCTPPASKKFLRTLPYGASRMRQVAATDNNRSDIDRALHLQSQNAMKDLPVFSALRDMHMQAQAPEKPPRRPLPPPALLLPVPNKEKIPKASTTAQDIEMPLISNSEKTSTTARARLLLGQTASQADAEGEKVKSDAKEDRTDVSQAPNGKQKMTVRDGTDTTSMSRKSSRDEPPVPKRMEERKVSYNGTSPRKGKVSDEPSVKASLQPSEKAKGKAKEVVDRPREKDRKKSTGFFSDSDEEEGPVIKRRKIMGGARVVDAGDRETHALKHKKSNVERERGRAERERTEDGKGPGKAAEKKQRVTLEDRHSRQGTPGSEKSKSTITTVKEKRPKPEATVPSRDKSPERKLNAGPPRKNSQTSTSTRTGNDAAEEMETPVRLDKKKKAADGKSKAGGKSEINPLLPLSKEGALIWKWKGVHKRVLKVAWSPNLNKLAACSFDGQCGIFDFEESAESASGKLKALTKLPYKCSHRGIESLKPVTDVNWNPEGTLLGTICDDGVARTFTPDGSLNSILTRHAGPIRHLAFNVGVNRDEGILVTAGSDGLICTWNLDNGNVKWQLNFHMPNQAYFVDFMDGQIFATCSEDTTIGLCSTKSGNPLMILRGHSDRVLMVRFSPAPRNEQDKSRRLLASASEDKTIRIWDVEGLVAKGAELFASMGGSYNERLAAARTLDSTSRPSSAGGKPVLARVDSMSDEVSDIPSQIMKLDGHDWEVAIVQWDPQGVRKDGKRLLLSACQCNDGEVDEETYKAGHTIKMYDVNAKSDDDRCLYTLREHEATINALTFSPDGDKFASVSDDHTMIIWDTLTGKSLRRYETDTQLNDVCWRYDGKQIAIAAEDSTIRTFYVGDL